MSKPATYVNGRGETICTSCVTPIKSGYCECNRHRKQAAYQIELCDELPVVGKEYDIDYCDDSGISARIKVTEIRAVNWWMRPGKTPGIEVWITFSILEVIEVDPPRPKLTLVK